MKKDRITTFALLTFYICYILSLILIKYFSNHFSLSLFFTATMIFPSFLLIVFSISLNKLLKFDLLKNTTVNSKIKYVYATSIFAIAVVFSVSALKHGFANKVAIPVNINTISYILMITLIPLAEELFFRGILLNIFINRYNKTAGVIAVSILFALMHFQTSFITIIVMFLLSVLISVVFLISRNLIVAFTIHSMWNSLTYIITVNKQKIASSYSLIYIFLIGLLLVIFLFLIKTKPNKKYLSK